MGVESGSGPDYFETVLSMSDDPEIHAAVGEARRNEWQSTDTDTLRKQLELALDKEDLDIAEQIQSILADRLD